MVYSIITQGGSEVIASVLNAVAMAVGEDHFHSILRLSVLLGFLWVLSHFLIKGSPLNLLSWFMSVFLLYNVLLVPKMTIAVSDNITHEKRLVDNVPLGVGLMASVTSQIGESLTRLFESVFTVPDDLTYSKTGFVMASRLVDESRKLTIKDSTFLNHLHRFMQQCVLYDLARGKYALDDLLSARETNGDLWAFMNNHASPLQGFLYQGDIITCQDGAKAFQAQWQQAIPLSQTELGQRLFRGMSPERAKAMVLSQLPLSVAYLTGISQTATHLTEQNLLLNALESSLTHHAASLGATAALTQYATDRANHLIRGQFSVSYALATHWLPLAKSVIEALLIGGFLLVAVMMLLPGGTKTVLFYVKSLLWLQLWAPLYAILHGMMLTLAKDESQSLISLNHTNTLDALTWSGIVTINHDMALYAGYATLLIPLIAWGLVSGAGFAVTVMASHMLGNLQSDASRSSEEALSGNLSYGNVNIDNTSAHNTNMHHYNTRGEFMDLGFTEQLNEGSTLSTMPGGGKVLDNHPALSQLAVSGDFAQRLSQLSQTQYETSLQSLETTSRQYSYAVSTLFRELSNLGNNLSHLKSDTTSVDIQESMRVAQSLQVIEQLAERFAENEHISVTKAKQVLGEVYMDGHLGFHSGNHVTGHKIEQSLGLSLNATAGGRLARLSSTNQEEQVLHQHAQEFIHETQYQVSLDNALQTVQEWSARQSQDETTTFSKDIATSLEHVGTLHEDVGRHLNETQSVHDVKEFIKDHSFTVNQNANQAFLTWLTEEKGVSVEAAENLLLHNPQGAEQTWQAFAANEMARLRKENPALFTKDTLKARYEKDANVFDEETARREIKTRDTQTLMKAQAMAELKNPLPKSQEEPNT